MRFVVSNTQVDQWNITSTEFRVLIAKHKSALGDVSAASVALPALRTFSDMPELHELTKTIRLTSDLAKLTLESIESQFLVDARDLVDRDATGLTATDGHTPCCHWG
jgi:hypothetical protein